MTSRSLLGRGDQAAVNETSDVSSGGVEAAPGDEQLIASDSTQVWRVGDTVRRQPHSGSAAVRHLLTFLATEGFAYAPEYLGDDERGREVYRWIDGDPLSDAMSDEQLAEVGRVLRQYHDLVAAYRPPPDARWRTSVTGNLGPGEIVIHNDVNPGNLIWRDNRIVGLIDWDFARPGYPDHDLAYAAMRCAPLFPPESDQEATAVRQAERVLTLAEGYGHDRLGELPECLALMQIDTLAQLARLGRQGDGSFATFWGNGWAVGFFGDQMSWLNTVRPQLERLLAGK